MIDFQKEINAINKEAKKQKDKGNVADYIPELSTIDPNKFGIAILDKKGNYYAAGDAKEPFSIQSISKVFSLAIAFSILGRNL